MQYDLIYPSDIDQIRSVPCVVAASYFEAKELIAFGVSHSAFDVQNPFVEDNEFEKAFKLWDSPFYLKKFFNDNLGDSLKNGIGSELANPRSMFGTVLGNWLLTD